MEFTDIGPLQLLVIGFDQDADYQGRIMDELDRLVNRGLIRVIDLQFVMKGTDGELVALEVSSLTEQEAVEFGKIADYLMRLATDAADEVAPVVQATYEETSHGFDIEDIASIADDLEPGAAIAAMLFEHTWAARLKRAVRSTGGYPIAQGFLTPEVFMMVGEEVKAIVEAESAIEHAEALKGAAILDALVTVDVAEQLKTAAVAEAVQALIVADLIEEAAAREAIDVLWKAGLIEGYALEEAKSAVEAAEQQMTKALTEINAALGAQ